MKKLALVILLNYLVVTPCNAFNYSSCSGDCNEQKIECREAYKDIKCHENRNNCIKNCNEHEKNYIDDSKNVWENYRGWATIGLTAGTLTPFLKDVILPYLKAILKNS
jgi:hypothetical protein